MIERKCLACGTWNKDERFCTNCGNAIHPDEILKIEAEKKRIEEANKPKDQFDILAEKMKNHRSGFVRFTYRVMQTIGMIFAAVGAFFAWLVAMANG